MRALVLAFWLAVLAGNAVAQVIPPVPGAQALVGPCDYLSHGCISAWSVIERMIGAYKGTLFQLWRSDGGAQVFGSNAQTGLVNVSAIHSFCDGYDCFFQYIYDQAGANTLGPGPNWPGVNTLPLLGWDTNGLPTAVALRGPGAGYGPIGSLTATQNLGGFLVSGVATNVPTTGSRTMYVDTDNFNWGQAAEFFSYAANAPYDLGGFAPVVMQTDPNTPSGAIFGMDLEDDIYDYGAYEAGYAQLVGVDKYNAVTNQVYEAVITSTCIPSTANSCNAQTTYSNYPNPSNPSYTINTGLGSHPLYFHLFQGTDDYPYPGRFRSAALAAYATSQAEDSAFLNSMARVDFAKAPSPCGAVTSTLTAAKPSSSTSSVPQSYVGAPTLNQANLVAAWGTSIVNPDWTGALFRVQRQDNNATYEVYPLGCAADAQAIAQDCAGTTCWVTRWYDQSGHNWTLSAPSLPVAPTLSPTGMNGKACIQFTEAAGSPSYTTFTASLAASVAGNVPSTGILTVTNIASGPALTAGATIQGGGIGPLAVILPFGTAGTTGTGSTGTYALNFSSNIASETMNANASTQLVNDPSLWLQPSGGSGYGLWQNQTVEAVFQGTSGVTGTLINMPSAWSLALNTSTDVIYAYNGGSALVNSTHFTLDHAHFVYVTADASKPQNLASTIDNGTPTTGTTTQYAGLGQAGAGYAAGNAYNSAGATACQAMLAVYNDIENASNLLAHYNWAHATWATP